MDRGPGDRAPATSGGTEERTESLEIIKESRNEKKCSEDMLTVTFLADGMVRGAKTTKIAEEIRKEIAG